jgi:hypothetical protein
MDEIEKMTLELLTNKNQYNKYLSKEDPKKFREHQEYLEKIAKFKGKILNLSKQFLENPEKSFNLEMDEMFSIFAKTSIKYLEMRELENENLYNMKEDKQEEQEQEETLFGNIDENIENIQSIDHFELDENLKFNPMMNSFWGKNIKKYK